jgi:hypothetical protein
MVFHFTSAVLACVLLWSGAGKILFAGNSSYQIKDKHIFHNPGAPPSVLLISAADKLENARLIDELTRVVPKMESRI